MDFAVEGIVDAMTADGDEFRAEFLGIGLGIEFAGGLG